jgi:hypothetical protein
MRTRTLCLTIGAAVAAAAAGIGLAGDDAPPKPADPLVVHEWGTFTSMQGADGLVLEGLSRSEEELPDFVYSRTKVRDCPLRDKGWKGLEVPADHVTQKMETPVLYFHSASARRLRVRVDFMQGLISQWYPVSDLLGPPEGARDAGPLDVSKVERSFLEWDVDVLPAGAAKPDEVPSVSADDPWTYARDVDANWVRTLPRKAPDRAGPVEAERYLFYRGLGSFRMPLTVDAARDAKFTLKNAGDDAIGSGFVVEVKGDRGRIAETNAVAAHGETKAELKDGAWWGPVSDIDAKLREFLAARLVASGLARDEARAMVLTWSRSWFTSEGTRVLWIVPRSTVDRMLPLDISPKPDAIVRVLVGRLEIVTPEVADEVEGALRDRASSDAGAARSAGARLARLGRFLEPHLRNVLARTSDPAVKRSAEAELAKLADAR